MERSRTVLCRFSGELSATRVRREKAVVQGRKSLYLCWTGVLRIRWFDPIAEASQLPDHSRGAPLLRLFGDGWAPFFVTDSLVGGRDRGQRAS